MDHQCSNTLNASLQAELKQKTEEIIALRRRISFLESKLLLASEDEADSNEHNLNDTEDVVHNSGDNDSEDDDSEDDEEVAGESSDEKEEAGEQNEEVEEEENEEANDKPPATPEADMVNQAGKAPIAEAEPLSAVFKRIRKKRQKFDGLVTPPSTTPKKRRVRRK